jgi:transposase
MTKTKNQFTTEFKRECVHLVLNQSYSVLQAAKAMDVGQSSLQCWLRQYRQEVKGITLQARAISPEQQRIQAL